MAHIHIQKKKTINHLFLRLDVMRFGIDQQNINTSRVDHPSPHSWRLVCLSFQLFRLAITSFIIVFHPEDLIHILILLWLNMEYITRLSLESICQVNCILSRPVPICLCIVHLVNNYCCQHKFHPGNVLGRF